MPSSITTLVTFNNPCVLIFDLTSINIAGMKIYSNVNARILLTFLSSYSLICISITFSANISCFVFVSLVSLSNLLAYSHT